MTTSSSTEPHCALPIGGSHGFLRQLDRAYKQVRDGALQRNGATINLTQHTSTTTNRKSRSRIPSSNNNPVDSPAPTFAVLEQDSIIHTPLGEWLSNPSNDIHGRLAAHYSLPGNPSTSNQSQYPQSVSSSMARTYLHMPSTASAYTPSLLYSEATPTESSVSTGLASGFSGVPLLEEIDGVLERRPNYRQPVFECAFWFLSCSYISHDQEEWRTHCLSHFRGEEPPKSVQCPLCEDFRATCGNGGDAWNARMDHIASCHHMLGHTLRTSRPDFHLFQHLWQKHLIDDADLKELKGGNHNLTRAPLPFVVTNGRNRRRDQRSQHAGRGR